MARVILTVVVGTFLLLGSPALGDPPSYEPATTVQSELGAAESPACQQASGEATAAKSDGVGCHGIVTCSFTVAGRIIALPFQILGAVLGVVF